MAEHSELHAFIGHENPSIVAHAAALRRRARASATSATRAPWPRSRARARSTSRWSAPTNRSQAGVVDALMAQGTRAVGPTRAGAEIEWNKTYARSLLAEHRTRGRARCCASCAQPAQVHEAVDVVRLDARRGQALGAHRRQGREGDGPAPGRARREAEEYAIELLERGGGRESVLIEEKIDGAEFTIQAISDGSTVIFPPSTYDFPYRFDGDEGPGTGGMGSLTMRGADRCPFMTRGHYEQACSIIQRVIERLAERGQALHRRHEQRLLRHRRRRQGDRVQRPLRRPRVHEHHEPVRGQLARGDGAPGIRAALAAGDVRAAR